MITQYSCMQCREDKSPDKLGTITISGKIKIYEFSENYQTTNLHVVFCLDNQVCIVNALEELRNKSAGIVFALVEQEKNSIPELWRDQLYER